MTQLQKALRELKNRGDTALLAEVEALEKILSEKPKAPAKSVAHRLLAHAAKLLREEKYEDAHNYLGASVEAFIKEKDGQPVEVSANVMESLPLQGAPDTAFTSGGDPIYAPEDSSDFADAQNDTVSVFANILLNGGYIDEARKYLTAYNQSQEPQDKEREMKVSQKEALASLKSKYKKQGDLVRARALDEILADLEEGDSAEGAGLCKSEIMEEEVKAIVDEGKKAEAEKACYLAKAAEEMLKDPAADQSKAAAMMKAAEEMMSKAKECSMPEVKTEASGNELYVEAPSDEELEAQNAAEAAALSGDVAKASENIKKVERLKATRTIAALLKKGDFELAKEGLAALASEEQAAPLPEAADSEPKNAGYPVGSPEHEDEEKEEMSELPKTAKDAIKANTDEKQLAESLFRRVRSLARSGNLKAALATARKLDALQSEVAAAVKKAKGFTTKEVTASERRALLTEGRDLLAGIHWLSLSGQKIIAEELGDKDLAAEIADAMDKIDETTIEDTLDSEPKLDDEADDMGYEAADDEQDADDAEVPAPAPAPEMMAQQDAPKAAEPAADAPKAAEPAAEMETAPKEESEAMHYEVLQSFDQFGDKPMSREALAFTFWANEQDPYWVIQASGKPVAEVHLADQDHADDVAAFFCDEVKWPNVVAQTVEKVGLVKMLQGVKARFYANAVTKGSLAGKMKEEALAALASERKERLAALRQDFTSALIVAAESLNKGLLANKPNPLKKAFVERLASLGIHNPALIVEEAFAEAFEPFLDQVVADAHEYLEMPKEAFVMTKKMVSAATNVAQAQVTSFANETLRDRLARTSMPLAPTEPAFEAPAAEREVRAALDSMSAREHSRVLRTRLQLSRKF